MNAPVHITTAEELGTRFVELLEATAGWTGRVLIDPAGRVEAEAVPLGSPEPDELADRFVGILEATPGWTGAALVDPMPSRVRLVAMPDDLAELDDHLGRFARLGLG